MIISSVRIAAINGKRNYGPAVTFQWDVVSDVDAVTMDLYGQIWVVDFNFLAFGGYAGGDISITNKRGAKTVEMVLNNPNGVAVLTFVKADVDRFVDLCIDETESNGYVLPAMREAQVDEFLQMMGL